MPFSTELHHKTHLRASNGESLENLSAKTGKNAVFLNSTYVYIQIKLE